MIFYFFILKTDHKSKNQITLKELISESEIKLYRKYGILPNILIVHLLLLFFLVLHIYNNLKETKSMQNHIRQIYNFHEISDLIRLHYIHNIQDLRSHLKNTINQIFQYKSNIIDDFEYLNNDRYYIDFIPLRKKNIATIDLPFSIDNPNPLENLKLHTIRMLLKDAEKLEISLKYKVIFSYSDSSLCVVFSNKYIYDFISRGSITFYIVNQRNNCDSRDELNKDLFLIERQEVLPLLILAVSIIELFFVVIKIMQYSKVWFQLKNNVVIKERLKDLAVGEKIKFLNLWVFSFLLCDVLLIYSKLVYYYYSSLLLLLFIIY